MAEKAFMHVDEVADELGISKSHAYKIVQQLNAELRQMGYVTIAGRVNRKYFFKKLCYSGSPTLRRKEQHGKKRWCGSRQCPEC